jgi:AcrR family transcriptional regulator
MLPSMAPPRASGHRLSVDDWIRAGFELLADGGPGALTIGHLCERLNVTKGSFYWHFTDIQAYRATLVDAWGERRNTERRSPRATGGDDGDVGQPAALGRGAGDADVGAHR